MIEVRCSTNLDVFNEKWPVRLPAVPVVGQKIQSCVDRDFKLTLEVVSVTWKKSNQIGWFAEVELHIPKSWEISIKDFFFWYAPRVGKDVSYFI